MRPMMRAALVVLLAAPGAAMLGPAWTRSDVEAPLGEKSMGTWTAAVYTEEQQARLGVDELGEPREAAAEAVTVPLEVPGWELAEGERCYGGLPEQPGLIDEATVESLESCAALADEKDTTNAFTYCRLCASEGWGQNCWIWTLPAPTDYEAGVTWCDTPNEYQGFTTGHRAGPVTTAMLRGTSSPDQWRPLAVLAAKAKAFLA